MTSASRSSCACCTEKVGCTLPPLHSVDLLLGVLEPRRLVLGSASVLVGTLTPCLKICSHAGGAKALYAGLTPTLVRAFPANAAQWLAWELLQDAQLGAQQSDDRVGGDTGS